MAGLAVERWHHDLNVLMLEVQTGVLGPLAPPDRGCKRKLRFEAFVLWHIRT